MSSEPGAGSTFELFLPASEESHPEPPRAEPGEPRQGGHETVLVVEDEVALRQVVLRTLRAHGYTTLAAAGGDEALALAAQHAGPIDLVVTDIIMPGMNGRLLAERLLAARPQTKVLFMSGYTDDVTVRQGELGPAVGFLPKPFTQENLLARLREVLDGE